VQGVLPTVETHNVAGSDSYDIAAFGDATINSSFDLSIALFGWGENKKSAKKKKSDTGKKKDKEPEPADFPHLSLGIGSKLPTGRVYMKDSSGDTIPPYYQPGTGSMDILLTAGYYQSISGFVPYASLTCTITGDNVDTGFKRGNRVSVSGGCRIPVDKDRGGMAIVSIMLMSVFENDRFYDNSGFTEELETKGVYAYCTLGYTMRPLDHLDVTITTQIPLTSPDTGTSANSAEMDYQFALELGYRF
jgi:hypothetical protein